MYPLIAPVVALGLVALVHETRIMRMLEYGTVNLRFQFRAPFDPPADPRLVFVGIDQQSLDHLGAWPWPRAVEADFLKTIAISGAAPHTVAMDLMFTDNRDVPWHRDADDAALGDAAGLLPSVITGALSLRPPPDPEAQKAAGIQTQAELAQPSLTVPLTDIRGDAARIVGSNVATFPIRALRKQSLFGFVNDEPSDIDDVRHSIPFVVRVQDKVYPSLALQTLCQMLNVDPDHVRIDLPAQEVTLRNSSGKTWRIPISPRGEFAVNYRRNDSFPSLSFFWLLKALQNSETGAALPPACRIANKTIFIGAAATALGDTGPTPLSAKSPLPYVHLNVINNVLRNDYLGAVRWPWVVLGWALVTWAVLFGLRTTSIFWVVAVPSAVVVLYTIYAFAIFWIWSLQIALVWPVLGFAAVNFGTVILRWRDEKRGKQQLKHLFSRMLPSGYVNHVLDRPETLHLGGSMRAVTILFSDIRDYTKFSEKLDTEELMRQLNVYFEQMVGCVEECRGTLHKFIGDAVMAVWGDIPALSVGLEGDARNAVRSALMMRHRLRDLNAARAAQGLDPLRIGIGLNHGEVAAGQIGASIRSEFTVIGDAVNVASRVEGLTKTFHTDLAVTESVRRLIGDAFLVRRLGLIQLKGKTEPTVVYEVLAESGAAKLSPWTGDDVAGYEQAFDDLMARRFAQAEAGFVASATRHPEDYCVRRYAEVSRDFALAPPPEEWDGRVVMETK